MPRKDPEAKRAEDRAYKRKHRGPRMVSNAPLRERLEQFADLTAPTVARRLDWYDTNGKADGRRVRRALGLDWCYDAPMPCKRARLRPSTAERIGAAMGMDPHEVGL